MFFHHAASPATPIYTANAIPELVAAKISERYMRESLLQAIRPSAENLQAETREEKERLKGLGYKELQAEFEREAYLQALEIRESQHTSKSSDAFACPPKGAMHL